MPSAGGQADKAGQGAGHGDHAQHLGAGAAALGAEQQCQAQSLVEHARKGVGRVDGDGGKQRIDFALEVIFGKGAGFLAELFPVQQADALFAQFGKELLVPAVVLGGHKGVNLGGEGGQGFVGAQAVVAGLAVAVLNALHQAGLADFHIFVEVGAGDGQELDALQQRVRGVFGLFQHTAIELHPGVVAAVEELLFLCSSGPWYRPSAVLAVYSVLAGCGTWKCRFSIRKSH